MQSREKSVVADPRSSLFSLSVITTLFFVCLFVSLFIYFFLGQPLSVWQRQHHHDHYHSTNVSTITTTTTTPTFSPSVRQRDATRAAGLAEVSEEPVTLKTKVVELIALKVD